MPTRSLAKNSHGIFGLYIIFRLENWPFSRRNKTKQYQNKIKTCLCVCVSFRCFQIETERNKKKSTWEKQTNKLNTRNSQYFLFSRSERKRYRNPKKKSIKFFLCKTESEIIYEMKATENHLYVLPFFLLLG